MDPITASLNTLTAALTLATKVWDATPDTLKTTNAGDWATVTHKVMEFLIGLQSKINGAVK